MKANTMFRWIKKKCQRKKIALFRPDQLVEIQEAEYHVYEEIPDIDINTFNIPLNCQCWLQRDNQSAYVCHCASKEPKASSFKRSQSLSDTKSKKFRMDFSKRPLPNLPIEEQTRSQKHNKHVKSDISSLYETNCTQKISDDAHSDSSSGYETNSVSSLALECDIEDVMLERLEDLYMDELNATTNEPKMAVIRSCRPITSTPISQFRSLPRTHCSALMSDCLKQSLTNFNSDSSRQSFTLYKSANSSYPSFTNSKFETSQFVKCNPDKSLQRNKTITMNPSYEPCESGPIIWSNESIYL